MNTKQKASTQNIELKVYANLQVPPAAHLVQIHHNSGIVE